MRTAKIALFGAVALCCLGLAEGGVAWAEMYHDGFEDGAIDPVLWVHGGAKRGWNGANVGDWTYSHEEVVHPTDGFFRATVEGPTSGLTYGAEAWVRSAHNYNDGVPWMINFTWEGEVLDDHYNHYLVQITDGFVPPDEPFHWWYNDYAGTVDLLWSMQKGNLVRGAHLPAGMAKTTWSISIEPSGTARLYDGPNATGSLLREEGLDVAYPWYYRLMVTDGTSAGFPSGEARLNLYDFQAQPIPEPASVVSALLGFSMLGAYLKRRAKSRLV
jgi:hypothetical protein